MSAPPAPGQAVWRGEGAAKRQPLIRPIALIGSVLIILGGPLPWVQFHFETSGWNLLFKFLITGKQVDIVRDLAHPSFNVASIGMALIVIGVLVLVLSIVPTAHVLRRFLGLLALAVPVVFVLQLFIGEANETVGSLFKDLGPGVYTAFVGGVLVLVG
jgi:hypothetical protein